MRCPICEHESEKALKRCSACRSVFESDLLEELGQAKYTQAWLDEHVDYLERQAMDRLQKHIRSRIERISQELRLDELSAEVTAREEETQTAIEQERARSAPVDIQTAEALYLELALGRMVISRMATWKKASPGAAKQFDQFDAYMRKKTVNLRQVVQSQQIPAPKTRSKPSELETIDYAIECAGNWRSEGGISHAFANELTRVLKNQREMIAGAQPVRAPARPPEPVPAAPPPPRVKEPPKPREPLLDWAKIRQGLVDAAASGALLRGLLYLGAFMIVVSLAVLVINFWNEIPLPLQIGFIIAVPGSFYLFGWLIRGRLKLPQAGSVFTGIGMLLVAIDFTAVYRFGGLEDSVDVNLYWFIASIFCTVLYAVTVWRVPYESFGYITCLALTSTLVSFGFFLPLDLGFIAAMIPLSAVIMLVAAYRLRGVPDKWAPLARSAERLPYLLIPVSQLLVLFAPGGFGWGQAATFAVSSVAYGMLAIAFPHPPLWRTVFSQAATWSSAAALAFLFAGTGAELTWIATAAAIASPIYLVSGRTLETRGLGEESARRSYLLALYATGFGMLGAAIIAGLVTLTFDLWAGVIALTTASLILAGCAYLFQRHYFSLAASGLFVLPFSLAFYKWLQPTGTVQQWAWLLVSWSFLALAYIGLAALIRNAHRYATWLYTVAHALTALVVAGVITHYVLSDERWSALPAIIALGGVVIVYALSAWILDSKGHQGLTLMVGWLPVPFDRSAFLWPLAVSLPLWVAALWIGLSLSNAWMGAMLAILALFYIAAGQVLGRRDPAYRLPFHVVAYVLPALGVLLALGNSWPLLVTLLLSFSVLVVFSAIYRRVWEAAAAALLFIWPVQLALTMSPAPQHAYSLVYALLATLIYTPVAMALVAGQVRDAWRYDPESQPSWSKTPQAMAVFHTGYGLAAIALVASLAGRFDIYDANYPAVGALVPLIIAGLSLFSHYRLRQKAFTWAAIVLFTAAYWQILRLLTIPSDYHAVAWVLLAFAYLLLERTLCLRSSRAWLADFRWPLGIGSAATCSIGVLLTAIPTYRTLFTGVPEDAFPVIFAQAAAAGLTILAAISYRNRLPLFIEPFLAFFPVTMFFTAYGERLLGAPLETAHFAFVWLGFSIVHLAIAALVDGKQVRYAHGLYLGGYAITLFALGWSFQDWATQIIALGIVVLIAAAEQLLVHFDRHSTWNDFVALLWKKQGTISWRTIRMAFLIIAVYAFPIWLVELLAFNEVSTAWRGAACALVAPLYVAMGLWLRRMKREYTWPLYSAGYALTALGAMIAYDDQLLFIAVLTLNTAVYAVSTYIFKQAHWLYISNVLVPVIALLVLDYNARLSAPWVAGMFMIVAYVYVACGWYFDRRSAEETISPFALPFYLFGYLLSAVSLAVATDERILAITVFTSAVVLYLLSAWLFHETIFLYPAAWLAAVPYFLVVTLTPLPEAWWGLALLPLVVITIAIGRFVFHRTPIQARDWPERLRTLGRSEMPFYLLAYAASVVMVIISLFDFSSVEGGGLAITAREDLLPVTLSLAAAAIIYFGSAALFRVSTWLYPGLLAAHLALFTALGLSSSGGPAHYTSLPFVVATWLIALTGLFFERRTPPIRPRMMPKVDFKIWRIEVRVGGWYFAGRLLTRSWFQPFYIFAAVDAVLWMIVALGGHDTAIIVALSLAFLMGLLATLWQDGSLVYVALIYLLIAGAAWLDSTGLNFAWISALLAATGFLLYFISEFMAFIRSLPWRLKFWIRPMERLAVVISVLALVGTLPTAAVETLATAAGLGFSGALYLAIAYRGRRYSLGYLAMAMLQIAWVLLLLERHVSQPQLYAIPAGLYFIIIGELERRQDRNTFANYLCAFGLAVMFVTSFIQSLDSESGLPYFILLLVESLAAIGYGVYRQEKIPFFGGLAAAFLNVTGQLVLLATISDVLRWIVILGTGLSLIALAILVERRREHLASQIEEWRAVLATWR